MSTALKGWINPRKLGLGAYSMPNSPARALSPGGRGGWYYLPQLLPQWFSAASVNDCACWLAWLAPPTLLA